MLIKGDKSIELLNEVILTHKALGSQETRRILASARAEAELNQRQEMLLNTAIDFVITRLCKSFHLTKNELLKGTSHGARMQALMVAFVIINKVMNLTATDMSDIFHKDRSNISLAITKYNQMRPENKFEAPIINICEEITNSTREYYNELKLKFK